MIMRLFLQGKVLLILLNEQGRKKYPTQILDSYKYPYNR